MQVNWDAEQECFESFSRELSSFYAVQYDPYLVDSSKSVDEESTSTEDEQVQSLIDGCQLRIFSMYVEITSETPSMALDNRICHFPSV